MYVHIDIQYPTLQLNYLVDTGHIAGIFPIIFGMHQKLPARFSSDPRRSRIKFMEAIFQEYLQKQQQLHSYMTLPFSYCKLFNKSFLQYLPTLYNYSTTLLQYLLLTISYRYVLSYFSYSIFSQSFNISQIKSEIKYQDYSIDFKLHLFLYYGILRQCVLQVLCNSQLLQQRKKIRGSKKKGHLFGILPHLLELKTPSY